MAEEDSIQMSKKTSNIINGKLTNTVTNKLKNKIWDEITIRINSLGFAEVRNNGGTPHEWQRQYFLNEEVKMGKEQLQSNPLKQ